MKKLILVSLMLVGCGYQKVTAPVSETQTVVVQERKLTDEQKFTLLRTEAHKRGLKWRVFCSFSHEGEFVGWAVKKDEPFGVLDSDGITGYWMETGADTQAGAAYALYLAIQGPPKLQHEDWYVPKKHEKICPPEITGE